MGPADPLCAAVPPEPDTLLEGSPLSNGSATSAAACRARSRARGPRTVLAGGRRFSMAAMRFASFSNLPNNVKGREEAEDRHGAPASCLRLEESIH